MAAFPTAEEAAAHFAQAFQETVGCVCGDSFNYPLTRAVGETQALVLAGGDDVPVGSGLHLFAGHYFKVSEAEGGGFAVTTGGYRYRIKSDEHGGELFSWHWDTRGVSWCRWPHLHVPLGDHLPTGCVALEQIVRWLILEAGVAPLKDDWDELLARNERDWLARRSWE